MTSAGEIKLELFLIFSVLIIIFLIYFVKFFNFIEEKFYWVRYKKMQIFFFYLKYKHIFFFIYCFCYSFIAFNICFQNFSLAEAKNSIEKMLEECDERLEKENEIKDVSWFDKKENILGYEVSRKALLVSIIGVSLFVLGCVYLYKFGVNFESSNIDKINLEEQERELQNEECNRLLKELIDDDNRETINAEYDKLYGNLTPKEIELHNRECENLLRKAIIEDNLEVKQFEHPIKYYKIPVVLNGYEVEKINWDWRVDLDKLDLSQKGASGTLQIFGVEIFKSDFKINGIIKRSALMESHIDMLGKNLYDNKNISFEETEMFYYINDWYEYGNKRQLIGLNLNANITHQMNLFVEYEEEFSFDESSLEEQVDWMTLLEDELNEEFEKNFNNNNNNNL